MVGSKEPRAAGRKSIAPMRFHQWCIAHVNCNIKRMFPPRKEGGATTNVPLEHARSRLRTISSFWPRSVVTAPLGEYQIFIAVA
jgi:hypothetical protein